MAAEKESPSFTLAGCVIATLVGRDIPSASTVGGTIPNLPETQGWDFGSRRLKGPEGNQTRLQSQ